MMRIAIFGGSFNPVTKGHTRLANYLVQTNIVDIVLMMPCYKSLYNKEMLSGEERLNLLSLTQRDYRVQPFDWEIRNKIENIGTYDIMKMLTSEIHESIIGFIKNSKKNTIDLYFTKALCKLNHIPEDVYFVIGLDNSQKVRKWIHGDKIVEDMKFIVVPRNGVDIKDDWFTKSPHIYVSGYEGDDVSSTLVKERIKKDEDVSDVLDPYVIDYLKEHKLYGFK